MKEKKPTDLNNPRALEQIPLQSRSSSGVCKIEQNTRTLMQEKMQSGGGQRGGGEEGMSLRYVSVYDLISINSRPGSVSTHSRVVGEYRSAAQPGAFLACSTRAAKDANHAARFVEIVYRNGLPGPVSLLKWRRDVMLRFTVETRNITETIRIHSGTRGIASSGIGKEERLRLVPFVKHLVTIFFIQS